jgi:hypothetical protein
MDDDVWWLQLYVMFSRATSMSNILLLQPLTRSLLERGPPANVEAELQKCTERVAFCKEGACSIARGLGPLPA